MIEKIIQICVIPSYASRPPEVLYLTNLGRVFKKKEGLFEDVTPSLKNNCIKA
jgi:hypothetical protein